MSILNILQFPDPRLRTRAKPVTEFDDKLKALVSDMFETMYHAQGIGLAASQIDLHIRLLIMDISEEKNDPKILVNPEIIQSDGEEEMDEGCLSIPGYYEAVCRAQKVLVKAQDEKGDFFEFDAEGLEAVCIQHEIDHLDGKLFVDYISSLKRERIRKKLEKAKKQEARA